MTKTGRSRHAVSRAIRYLVLTHAQVVNLPPLFIVVATLPFVFLSAFTGHPTHDDQGTLMLAFRDLMDGRVLYQDVFALYGPFYYFALLPVFSVFDVPLTHDTTRLISVCFWLSTAIIYSSFIYRLTASRPAFSCSYLIILLLTKSFLSSPLHPQEMIFLFIGLLLHCVLSFEINHSKITVTFIGLICSLLILIKLNAGILVTAPLIISALSSTINVKKYFLILVFFAILVSFIPLALMNALFEKYWVIYYCIISTLSIISSIMYVFKSYSMFFITLSHWLQVSFVGLFVIFFTFLAMLISGYTPFTIYEFMIGQNFFLILNWYVPLHINFLLIIPSVVSFFICFLILFNNNIFLTYVNSSNLLYCLKIFVVIYSILTILSSILWRDPFGIIGYILMPIALPASWIIAAGPSPSFTRNTMALLSSTMMLYAFPVAGAQLALSTVPFAIAIPLLVKDIVEDPRFESFMASFKSTVMEDWFNVRTTLNAVLTSVMLLALVWQTALVSREFSNSVRLGLSGALNVYVPEGTAGIYRRVTQELATCVSFYTIPGQPSFYFWTEKPSPTGIISNNTFGLLSDDRQLQVIRDLDAHRVDCILEMRFLLDVFDRGQLATMPPLLKYLNAEFRVADSIGPYRLFRRKGQPDDQTDNNLSP